MSPVPIPFDELQEMFQEDINEDGLTVNNNNITDVNYAISRLDTKPRTKLINLVNKRIYNIEQDLPEWKALANRPGAGESMEARRAKEFETELTLLRSLNLPSSSIGGRRKSRRNRKSKKSRNKTRKRRRYKK